MKRFKLMGKRGFAVFTSLALCAGLVAPSFAATFTELQGVIDSKESLYAKDADGNDTETVRIGYDSGTVTLYENVEAIQYPGPITNEETGKQETYETSIYIGKKDGTTANIVLDLNGKTITGNENADAAVIRVYGEGSQLTLKDSSDEKDGKITGGTYGGVVIQKGGSFTMEGGTITGNSAYTKWNEPYSCGGVNVSGAGSSFTMKGGEISGNTDDGNNPGAVRVMDGASFEMQAGTIKSDETGTGIGIQVQDNNSKFTMSGETGSVDGGVQVKDGAEFDMGDGAVKGDVTVDGSTAEMTGGSVNGVVEVKNGSTFTVSAGTVKSDNSDQGDIRVSGEGDKFVMKGDSRFDGTIYLGKGAQADGTQHNADNDGNAFGFKLADEDEFLGQSVDGEKLVKTTYAEPEESDPGEIEIPDVEPPLVDLPEVEIDEPEVPLAGLFTRADAIGYLWEQAGSPDAELSTFADVPEDHQWAMAIGWAQEVGIALPDLEGNFRPDDLVLRSVEDIQLSPEGELEQFLNRYAAYAGIVLEAGELFIKLEGEPDDIIMGEDAQIIFDDFFARLELALAQAA